MRWIAFMSMPPIPILEVLAQTYILWLLNTILHVIILISVTCNFPRCMYIVYMEVYVCVTNMIECVAGLLCIWVFCHGCI